LATTEYYGTGRRKTATARVFLRPGKGTIVVNKKPVEVSFPTQTLQLVIRQPGRSWNSTRPFESRCGRPGS
jgi:small subunit ribosomal protein S9